MGKLTALLRRTFGREFMVTLSYRMRGLKGYGIDTAWSDVPRAYWEEHCTPLNALIYLVRGVDDGRNAWYYIMVRPQQLDALNNDVIYLERHGFIFDRAFGDDPPEETKQ